MDKAEGRRSTEGASFDSPGRNLRPARASVIAQREFVAGNAHATGRLRSLVEGGLLTVLAVLLASTWHARVFVVAGPSMAETIMGEHRGLTCRDCGSAFRCAADEPEMPGRCAVCPNCGDARQRLDKAPRQAADAIVVDRSAFVLRPPRRWELAAFRGPERSSQVYVKRIVGLPNETIELRYGDVYANGDIQRKSLSQLRASAVPVYDSRYEPGSLESRWLPERADGGWRQSGSRYRYIAGTDNQSATDWLTYHHRRRLSTGGAEECAVTDDMGYNQERPVIQSHHVRDLFVCCRIAIASLPALSWSITDGTSQFLVRLDFARNEGSVMQDGRPLGSGTWQTAATASVRFELALCDQQLLAALDERLIFSVPYEVPNMPFRPTSRPLAVGAQDRDFELSDLVLWRDVYYRPPRGKPPPWQDRLAEGEYFVLGDNSPASLDSRDWPAAAVAAGSLVGKPVLACPSGLAADGAALQFKVPVLSRFRYIQ